MALEGPSLVGMARCFNVRRKLPAQNKLHISAQGVQHLSDWVRVEHDGGDRTVILPLPCE